MGMRAGRRSAGAAQHPQDPAACSSTHPSTHPPLHAIHTSIIHSYLSTRCPGQVKDMLRNALPHHPSIHPSTHPFNWLISTYPHPDRGHASQLAERVQGQLAGRQAHAPGQGRSSQASARPWGSEGGVCVLWPVAPAACTPGWRPVAGPGALALAPAPVPPMRLPRRGITRCEQQGRRRRRPRCHTRNRTAIVPQCHPP